VCTQVVHAQHMYVRGKSNTYPTYIHDCLKDNPRTPLLTFKKSETRAKPLQILCNRMYVHWWEREHEELDVLVEEDLGAISMLKQCGMWKFFQCPFMRAQPRLLNHLIEYWHPDAEAFMLEGQSLTPMTEDI
jgi:hypothetical protein